MEVGADEIRDCRIRGEAVLHDSRFNHGLAFTIEERQSLGILGLLPPRVMTIDEQMKQFLCNLRQCSTNLERFIYAMNLYDINKRLFFHVVSQHVKELMPIIYTPTIGDVCLQYSQLYHTPRGLYITINDKGHVYDILCNWPEANVKAIVVTDGERILGLGDLGACGMGIPVGKLALYTAIGGIDPTKTLPICLDVGTNNQKFLQDEFYIGLRQPRERGARYQEFLDEFMEACVKRWGHKVLIQFEDFGPDNAFNLLARYRRKYHTFNDDIQGTAVVACAGIIVAMRMIKKKKLSQNTFLFYGAGQAAAGMAALLYQKMIDIEGLSEAEAAARIYLIDSKGLVVKDRPDKRVYRDPIVPFVKVHEPLKNLIDIVSDVKPTILVGAAAQKGAFTEAVLRKMGELNERPVIMVLSNPTTQMECTAEEAYTFTEGRAVYASGTACPPVTLPNGKVMIPGQANNAYVFPAVALAATSVKAKRLPDSVFIETCRALTEQVSDADLEAGSLYPPLEKIREVCLNIAVRLAEFMFRQNLATFYPEPEDKKAFVRSCQFRTTYGKMTPNGYSYSYPKL